MFKWILMIACCISSFAYAVPHEIIIVRHGDKLNQLKGTIVSGENNLTLDPKGWVRAVILGKYILKHHGNPDYVITARPIDRDGKVRAVRILTTANPIVNMLSEKDVDGFRNFEFIYNDNEYSKLANDLLNNKKYDKKKILVIWNHTFIPALVNLLGVDALQPVWPSEDYDSVYVLQYDVKGHLKDWAALHQQYPIHKKITWDDIANLAGK